MNGGQKEKTCLSTAHCPPSTDYLRRYARQIVLPQIGEEGQARLAAASVLVVGAGGLGSSVAGFLAAAGVGRLVLCDHDRVELSNLNRQILFETADIGQFKVDAAQARIEEISPDCRVVTYRAKLDAHTAPAWLGECNIVADGSDNFATRLLLNQACVTARKTLVSAAISGFEAQLSTFKPHEGAAHPCYQCLVNELPQRERDCAQEGMIGPLAGALASLQALEVVKELLGIGESLSGRLLRFDGLAARWRESRLPRDPACCMCGALHKG